MSLFDLFKKNPEAKAAEVLRLHLHGLRVHLVDREEQGLPATHQQPGQLHIRRGQLGTAIDNHHNSVSFLERDLGLAEDLTGNQRLIIRNNATSIDNTGIPAHPLNLAIDPIPGDTRLIPNNRSSRAGEPVEESRFAHVWPPTDGDQWELPRVDALSLGSHL